MVVARSLASAMSGIHCAAMDRREPRNCYTRSDFLKLKQKPCVGLPRRLRRFLLVLGILKQCSLLHLPSSYPIPVRITQRPPPWSQSEAALRSPRECLAEQCVPVSSVARSARPAPCLTRIHFVCRPRRSRNAKNRYPSVLLANVRSLFSKYDEIKLRVLKLLPSIVVLTESWLSSETPDSAVDLNGYSVIRKDRNSHGGGILCYVRSTFSVCVIHDHEVPSLPSSDSEFLCFYLKEPHVVVIAVYHPFWDNVSAHNASISVISGLIDFAFIKYGSSLHVILCGDFNGLRTHFGTLSVLLRLSPVVNFSTRGSNTLDQIFVNFATEQKASSFPPFGCSDHLGVFWSPNPPPSSPSIKRKVRKFSKANCAKFRHFVARTDWLSFVNCDENVNVSSACFLHHLSVLYDQCFPIRTVRVRDSDPEWITFSLKILIDDRDRAFSLGQWAKYRRLREEVIKQIQYAKRKHIRTAASSSCPKRLWKSLFSVGRYKKKMTSSASYSAAEYSDFFASNFQTITPFMTVPASAINASVTTVQVRSMLRRLHSTGGGPDGIPSWVFKDSADFLSDAICVIFNKCFQCGVFPSCFKEANVVPIPKCSRPSLISDFRPISMLPILSKLFEKFILKKLVFPSIVNRLNRSQFAYIPRPGSGTTSALVTVYHKIVQFLDSSSGAVRFLSTDFSKAFDKLPHDVILSSCRKFSLPESVIGLLSSFLHDRKQRVHLFNDFSEWVSIPSGVPQGSVLGPVLFCLAIDDLSPVCDNSFIVKYADDISLLHFVRQTSDDRLQAEWDNIVSWSLTSHLPINPSKCRVIDFVTKTSLSLSAIEIDSCGSFLNQVSSLSFLGVIFSHDLRWNDHFDNVLKKACKRIFVIRNLRKGGCPPMLIWRVYVVLIRSVLLYAFPCFCNAPKFLLEKFLRLERRICRIVNDKDVCSPLLQLAAENTCESFFRKILLNPQHPLRELFTSYPSRSTRYSKDIQRPFAKTKRFSSSFIKYCK